MPVRRPWMPYLAMPLFIALVSAACGRGGGTVPAPAASPAPEWRSVPENALLYYDNAGGIQDSLRLVVRDADALQTLWRQATSTQAAPPPLPAVDFGREMLLVVAAGRMTPEDQIQVDSVAVRRERDATGGEQEMLDVVVRTTQGCRRFNADAYPVQIIRVQRFDGPVRWIERREQATGC